MSRTHVIPEQIILGVLVLVAVRMPTVLGSGG